MRAANLCMFFFQFCNAFIQSLFSLWNFRLFLITSSFGCLFLLFTGEETPLSIQENCSRGEANFSLSEMVNIELLHITSQHRAVAEKKDLCSELYLEERQRRGEGEDWLPCDLKNYHDNIKSHQTTNFTSRAGAGRFYWPVYTSGSCLWNKFDTNL